MAHYSSHGHLCFFYRGREKSHPIPLRTACQHWWRWSSVENCQFRRGFAAVDSNRREIPKRLNDTVLVCSVRIFRRSIQRPKRSNPTTLVVPSWVWRVLPIGKEEIRRQSQASLRGLCFLDMHACAGLDGINNQCSECSQKYLWILIVLIPFYLRTE